MPRKSDRNTFQHGEDHGRNDMGTEPEQDTQMPLNQSVSDSLTGDPANIPTPTSYLNLNMRAAMASVLECMILQQRIYHIPQFDGKNPPLKEFLQDISNRAVFVTEVTEPGFIKAVLARLKGVARESVRDKQFSKVKDLIAHLKKRFAPTKKYQWYFESIIILRMKQSETVCDYNDRVQGLLSGARHAIEEKYSGTYGHTKESAIMMKPVIDCALDAFIWGSLMIYLFLLIPEIQRISGRRSSTPCTRKKGRNTRRKLGTPRPPIISHSPENTCLSVHAHRVPSENKWTTRGSRSSSRSRD